MFLRYNVQDGFQAVSPTKYEIFRILRLKAAMNSKIGFEMKNNANNRRWGNKRIKEEKGPEAHCVLDVCLIDEGAKTELV